MSNFGDPLWGGPVWGGGTVAPTAPFTFPPTDPDEERNRIKIDQVWAIEKSGGKSVDASQFVTTVNPGPDGSGGMWLGGNWVYNGISAVPSPPPGATPILDRATGLPIVDRATGEWIFVR